VIQNIKGEYQLLTVSEVIDKLREIDPHYVSVLQTNSIKFLKMGVCHGYLDTYYGEPRTLIEIPDWDRFVDAIRKESNH
jgi:hypothetical protein